MSSAAALTWFARHEIRLAWRDWLAMMTAGRKGRKRAAIIGLTVFAAGENLTNRRYSGSVQVDNADGRSFEPSDGRSVYAGFQWSRQ